MKNKAFKKALASFNRVAQMGSIRLQTAGMRQVFAEEIALMGGKSGLVRRPTSGAINPLYALRGKEIITAGAEGGRGARSFSTISDLGSVSHHNRKMQESAHLRFQMVFMNLVHDLGVKDITSATLHDGLREFSVIVDGIDLGKALAHKVTDDVNSLLGGASERLVKYLCGMFVEGKQAFDVGMLEMTVARIRFPKYKLDGDLFLEKVAPDYSQRKPDSSFFGSPNHDTVNEPGITRMRRIALGRLLNPLCNCKERSVELGLPGLQCIMCVGSAERQEMHSSAQHRKGIFTSGATEKRVQTGMEVDLSVSTDADIDKLCADLRNGRYEPTAAEPSKPGEFDHRKVLIALKAIAHSVGYNGDITFELTYGLFSGTVSFGILVKTLPGRADRYLPYDVNAASAQFAKGEMGADRENTPSALSAFAVILAHTLDEKTGLFQWELVDKLAETCSKSRAEEALEKFKVSFRNILTHLGYGEEVKFEVIGTPYEAFAGFRAPVEFICDEPPIKAYEAINPAITEDQKIDFGEISRIERRLAEQHVKVG